MRVILAALSAGLMDAQRVCSATLCRTPRNLCIETMYPNATQSFTLVVNEAPASPPLPWPSAQRGGRAPRSIRRTSRRRSFGHFNCSSGVSPRAKQTR